MLNWLPSLWPHIGLCWNRPVFFDPNTELFCLKLTCQSNAKKINPKKSEIKFFKKKFSQKSEIYRICAVFLAESTQEQRLSEGGTSCRTSALTSPPRWCVTTCSEPAWKMACCSKTLAPLAAPQGSVLITSEVFHNILRLLKHFLASLTISLFSPLFCTWKLRNLSLGAVSVWLI